MPDLKTTLHLDMFRDYRGSGSLPARIYRAVRRELKGSLYGNQWGDPDVWDPLKHIRDHYVLPYVAGDKVAVEIGPGGGRWTRYLVGFGKLYAVDYHEELLRELRSKFRKHHNIDFIKNNGTDFPNIPAQSVDYLFSFGTFVHLDFNIIELYLSNIRAILKDGGTAVIQYSDKAKVLAKLNPSFSENTVERMSDAVARHGFYIVEEDTTTLWHSSVVRFSLQ